MLARKGRHIIKDLNGLAKLLVYLLLISIDIFLNEYRQHKAQLLIDGILFIFSFSL